MIRKFIIFTFIIFIISSSVSAGLFDTSFIAQGEASTFVQQTSMERDDDRGLMRFGSNNSTAYQYDGSSTTILTLEGQSYIEHDSSAEASLANIYGSQTHVETTGIAQVEHSAGTLGVKSHVPETLCDSNGFLDATMGGSAGRYPMTQTFEGRIGGTINRGVYESEVGLNDAEVHLKGTSTAADGFIYGNALASVKKGFDKNSNEQNSAYDTHVDAVARANSTQGLNALVQFKWLDVTDIYDEILESEVTNESVTSISKERLEEFVNETEVNETTEEE